MSWTIKGNGTGQDLLYSQAGTPSLDLRFASTKSLNDYVSGNNLITFTRASSATYVDSTGVLRTATTNLLLRSEQFSDAAWAKSAGVSVVIDSSQGMPFTGAVVSRVDFTGASQVLNQTRTYVSGPHAASIWIKGVAGETIQFAGETTISVAIETLTGSWQRLSQVFTAAVGTQNFSLNTFNFVTARTIYIAAAQLEQSSTVGEYIPTTSTINSAPRFDHDPTTGESLGLLVEEQRTNSITNNTMVGAVPGTPGTNPTGWFLTASANDINPEIVGTGVEDGVTYVDIRYSGTSTGAGSVSILASLVTAITAATGQSWTGSAYVKLQAGSLSNLTNTLHSVNGRSAIGAGIESTNANYTPTSDGLGAQRRTVSITLTNASTVRISHTIFNAAYASGAAIDFTLRIGLPQLEQGAFAASPILTSTAAVTRSADVCSITGSAFSRWYRQDEGTVFADARVGSGTFPYAYGISDGTGNNRIILYRINAPATSSTPFDLRIDSGGSNSASFSINAATTRFGLAYKANDFAVSGNGGAAITDTSGAIPSVNQMTIGGPTFFQCNGTVSRFTYWPTRLANSTLQGITQ